MAGRELAVGDTMMHGVIATRYNTAAWMRGAWRFAASLLVLAVGLHQLVMAVPAVHMAIMPMTDGVAAQPRNDATNCLPPCPVPLTSVCPAVQAALPHPSGVLIFLLVFAPIAPAFALLMPTAPQQRTPLYAWLWPPNGSLLSAGIAVNRVSVPEPVKQPPQRGRRGQIAPRPPIAFQQCPRFQPCPHAA